MATTREQVLPTLHAEQLLTRDEFMRRWEALPNLKFAELIDGVVYMPSPQTNHHGLTEHEVSTWLGNYRAATPGCGSGSQSTWLMEQSAPQPDTYLWILPEYGGQSRIEAKYHAGAPELAVEVCVSSGAYDLGPKKALYQRAGVREYVALVVEDDEILWHCLRDGVYELRPPTSKGIFRSEIFPGLWLDESALWKHDLARVLRTLQRGLDSAQHAAFVSELARRKD